MRIAITDFHNGWGGQALQALLLADGLARRGHEVALFAPPESDLAHRAVERGLQAMTDCTFVRGLRPRALWRDWRALRGALRAHRTEIVHCHGSQDTWLVAAARMLGGPDFALVRTKHNSYPVRAHACNRWLYGSAIDRLITVADSIREDILAAGVCDPSRVRTLHAGLDDAFGTDVPADARQAVREEFGIPGGAPVVTLVGRLAPDKGQAVLMRALKALEDRVPDAHALLVGTGGDYDNQKALRAELGLETRVHFTLFREDVARLTAASDVCVLAATACDASSTVLKEAMRLDVPVVGTDVGGTREILDDGRAGLVVPPEDPAALADALARTLAPEDPTALAERVAHARERVESHYSMRAVVQATEGVYQEALRARCNR